MNGDSGREIHWASTGMLHFRHSCNPPRKGTVWNAKCWSLAKTLPHRKTKKRRAESASHLPEESDIGLGNVLPITIMAALSETCLAWLENEERADLDTHICVSGATCVCTLIQWHQLSHLVPRCILGIAQWKELAILIGGLSRGPVSRCKQKGEGSQHG